jgi:DNA-binding response OmpR family regulator
LDEHSFLLELPRALGKLSGVSPPRARAGRGESVLIVEDEQPVRMAMARALRALGYNVMEARLGGDARDLVRGNNVDLVITDVVLPDGDGLELLSELCRTAARARGLVVTGYADRELARLNPEVPLLRKPFSTLDLARKVRGALDSRDS